MGKMENKHSTWREGRRQIHLEKAGVRRTAKKGEHLKRAVF
jgi:hypothetical protein